MLFETRRPGVRMVIFVGCLLTGLTPLAGAHPQEQVQSSRPVLAITDFALTGLAVKAEPAHQDVPRHIASLIITRLAGLDGNQREAPPLNPNYRVRGELIGPSLHSPKVLESEIGVPLVIPPLALAGDHFLTNLRVVDTGLGGAPTVAEVIPDTCSISVIDQLLVSEVRVRELSYDEITASGIHVSPDSYSYYNFTLALATSSQAYEISIPVAMPNTPENRPVAGLPQQTAQVGVKPPTPDVLPLLLEVEQPEGGGGPELEGGTIRIPGLIVFPGRIALLHQFFEAIVIVGNGAPGGTPLVVHSLRARVELPQAANPLDNPLRVAEVQVGGAVEELELHGLGADGTYGTGDDTSRFAPGESGQAAFLLEGLKEGLHTVKFRLQGTLDGLSVGPVTVRGEASGAVRVRDASFAVSFTHPGVVRAGQEYDLGITLFNSGSRDILGANADLSPARIIGADLVNPGSQNQQTFPVTLKPGESGTVTWRLKARVTGAVSASYTKVEGAQQTELQLVTGVGDRNVPLSPDSLILPDAVRYLPPPVVEASSALLGQAWSVATAPSGSLPDGVLPVSRQTVLDSAIQLGVAGLRVRFGEPLEISLVTLLRDWLGESRETLEASDAGFVQAVCSTKSGFAWQDRLGEQLALKLGSQAGTAFHKKIAEGELARSRFLSVLVSGAEGGPFVGARLIDPEGQSVGLTGPQDRFGAVPAGAMLRLDWTNVSQARSRGGFLLVSNPATGAWSLELSAWAAGVVDISIWLPIDDDLYRQVSLSGVPLGAGGKYRVRFNPYVSSSAVLEQCVSGSCSPTGLTGTVGLIDEPAPKLVGVLQVGPSVLEAGDRYGRMLALLFSKPVNAQTGENASNYAIGGGTLVGSNPPLPVGGPVAVLGARLNFGDRFSFLKPSIPIGPFIQRTMTVTGVTDTRGLALSPPASDQPIEMTVSPGGIPMGGYLTGRVLNADGTPIPGALVELFDWPCGALLPIRIADLQTDSTGRYVFDYVVNGDCSPVIMKATHPATASQKGFSAALLYHGQHLVMDFVFLARGSVQGAVTMAGQPVASAQVQIISNSDQNAGQLVRADSTGKYFAYGVPVGGVSILAVGAEGQTNATGFGAGWIDGPGKTATVNVALQSISGSVQGRVLDAGGKAVPRAVVIAQTQVQGLTDPVVLGVCYAAADGTFQLTRLPLGAISIFTTDGVTGLRVWQQVQLTSQNPSVTGVVLSLPGYGSISGRVIDQAGNYLAFAEVRCGFAVVASDPFGYYHLPMLSAGNQQVTATNPTTGLQGSVQVTVYAGRETTGVDVVVSAAATIRGTVSIVRSPGLPAVPLPGTEVTYDGYHVARTNSQGVYVLPNVPPGQNLILRFIDPTRRLGANQPLKLLPGETLIRNLTFHPGAIGGKVFQPDGQTAAVARVTVYVLLPNLSEGYSYGLLTGDHPITTISAADGSYHVANLNPGGFRISAFNDFFPTPVGRIGTLPPDSVVACNLTLVNTLAGKIQGKVFQPDGVTPAPEGTEVTLGGGHLADAMVRTDASGFYSFPEVFSTGTYNLTAIDPVKGYSNRIRIAVERNKDCIADIRLLGRGSIHVKVIDATGTAVESGTVTVSGLDYPNASVRTELSVGSGGLLLFEDLPEGPYSVTASRQDLSGRVSAVVLPSGSTDVTVQLQSCGAITGRVLMADGVTPVGLADVRLIIGGRTLGFTVSNDDAEGNSFLFTDVPLGDFKLEAYDNRSTRVGRTAGRIDQNGETVTANILLVAIGTVRGQVTANNAPVDHAYLTLQSGEFGFSSMTLKATTDASGNFSFPGVPTGKFTISATHPASALTGYGEGILPGGTEPLPDKIVNIALEYSATLDGTVYDHQGAAAAGARVTATIGSRVFTTDSRADGKFRLDFVPLGDAIVRALAVSGNDRGQTGPVTLSQPGSTVPVEVRFDGVGTVKGDALDSDGVTGLVLGTVTLTNSDWSPAVTLASPVQAGKYELQGVPAGPFSLRLTVPNRSAVGTASGTLQASQTLTIPLVLEPAGIVTGKVVRPDATTPAVGADVTVYVTRAAGGTASFVVHTDAAGLYRAEQISLGTVDISVHHYETEGLALISGLSLATNGQVLDVPLLVLDESPIAVQSVSPTNGSVGVSRSTVVTVTFTEAAKASTVNSATFKLLKGASQIGASVALSADGLVATLTPTSILPDNSTFTAVVTTQVTDLVGRELQAEFRSTFTTPDETPPVVTSIDPAWDTKAVALDRVIQVSFNEALDPQQSFAGVVRLFPEGQPQALVPLVTSLGESGITITARPSVPLTESTRYEVEIKLQKDRAGNIQTALYSSSFSTVDRTKPVIDSVSIEGQMLFTVTPLIVVKYHDDFSGIDITSLILRLDGVDIRPGAQISSSEVQYQVPASTPLPRGPHTLEVQIADKVGNQSDLKSAKFTVDDIPPQIANFTIAGQPAIAGMVVNVSRPIFEARYSDNGFINREETKLWLGPEGGQLTPQAATVWSDWLQFQPVTDLLDGQYVVELVVTDSLGNCTRSGLIHIVIQANGPQISAFVPLSGIQHGGTPLVIEGVRLLEQNGGAPSVRVGGNSAYVLSVESGPPQRVTIMTPAGSPGPALIEVQTAQGGSSVPGFVYEPDSRTPFAVGRDTVLLWHLDEPWSGGVQVQDSGPLAIHGYTDQSSLGVPGRFASGRSGLVTANNDYGLLNPEQSSMTLECFVNTLPVTRTYILVGKQAQPGAYGLSLLPSGAVRAWLRDGTSLEWSVTTDPNGCTIVDGQWHYLGMVLDRDTGLLRVYVDGAQKASSPQPPGFDTVSNTSRLTIGACDTSDASPGPTEFPGSLDEVRISSSAHSASAILEVLFGQDGPLPLVIGRVRPTLLRRGVEEEVSIYGYNLAGATTQLLDADGTQLTSQILASSATEARVRVVIPANGEVGEGTMHLRSSRGDASVPFRIVDPVRSKPELESDTVVLWHFEGAGEGGSRDDGPFALSWGSLGAPGFYRDGRGSSFQTRTTDGLLDFLTSSFTLEAWALVGFNQTFSFTNGSQSLPAWQLQVSSSGSLVGSIWNAAGVKCTLEAPAKVMDPTLGYLISRNVDEPNWHHLAMVVDRETSRLRLYIDGLETGSTAIPADFGPVRKITGSSLRLYGWSKGSVDEVRISHTAHDPSKIWEDVNGTHPFRITSILPLPVTRHLLSRGVTTRLRIKGYDLPGLRAELRRDALTIAVCSIADASYSEVLADFVIPSNIELGTAEIVLIKTGQPDAVIPAEIVDSRPFTVERDTLLLWHLDETVDGGVTIADAGAFGLNGTDSSGSRAALGRFNNGRQSPRILRADDEGTILGGNTSLTAQCWFKTSLLDTSASYRLAGRGLPNGGWDLLLLPPGILRAQVGGSIVWQAEVPVIRYDSPSASKSVLLDNAWHMATMVVDWEANLLSIYVDGSLRASAPKPPGFIGGSASSFGVGQKYDTKWGPEAFPGIVDDVRVSVGPHSAARIWNDFAGIRHMAIRRVSRNTVVRDSRVAQPVDTEILIEGHNLEGVSPSVTRGGTNIPGVTAGLLQASSDFARIQVTVSPSTAVGLASLRLAKPDGQWTDEPIYITESPLPPLESDTALLWHLDEPGNGEVSILDSTRFRINGKTDAESVSTSGRFGLGRGASRITADPDFQVMNFGQSSFTAECWVKTANLQKAYTLLESGASGSGVSFRLQMLRNGVLQARLEGDYAPGYGRVVWRAEAKPYLIDETGRWSLRLIADDQWHHISMVVDQNADLLQLYVDGVKRAMSPMPAGFGKVFYDTYNPSRFRAGFSEYSEEFPGIIDEIRISSMVHSEEKVVADFLGHEAPEVTAIQPPVVARGSTQCPVTLHGFGLSGASVSADDSSVEIITSAISPDQIQLLLTVPESRPAGTVRLTVTDPAGLSCFVDLLITAPRRFENPSLTDDDTLILWHLDETGTGAVSIVGSGDSIPAAVGATSSTTSLPAAGRFEGGRTLANLVATGGFGSSEPGADNFSVDCWFKSRPVGRPYILIGRSDVDGYHSEFEITLMPSGILRASLRDASSRYWSVDTPLAVYDQTTGTWNICIVDDEQWHLATMVVDRVTQQLLLYVDGQLRASAARPLAFTTLLNTNQRVRAGMRNVAAGSILFPDSDQFPGVLDEIRITKHVRKAEEIEADFGRPVVLPLGLRAKLGELRAADGPFDQAEDRSTPGTPTEPFVDPERVLGESLLLWHLDERANGAVRIAGARDAVREVIGGTASPASIAEEGRFGGGRTQAGIVADPDHGSLDFGVSSFTLEFWLRTDPVFATYTLAGRDGPLGHAKDFGLTLLPSGRLRAWLYDTAGQEWSAETESPVDDSHWRLITMSVDREAGWLYLLIDDDPVAAMPCPAGFSALRNQGQSFRAGHLDVNGPATFVGPPAEFPGVLDEVRILNYARKPEGAK